MPAAVVTCLADCRPGKKTIIVCSHTLSDPLMKKEVTDDWNRLYFNHLTGSMIGGTKMQARPRHELNSDFDY